jgi:hypothetical protein
MKTIALLLILALPAYAADDAPLADVPNVSVRLEAGDVAPHAGYLVADAEHVDRAKRLADAEATLAKARESWLLPPAAVVAIIAGSLALGVAAGTGVALAFKR